MKLQNRKKKILTIAIITGVVLLLMILGTIIGMVLFENNNSQNPEIQGIAVSISPKTNYYVGDDLDATGMRIQVITDSNETSYYVDYPNSDILLSGFDSSTPNEFLLITVSYKGYSAQYAVSINERPSVAPILQSIALSDNFQTTYTMKDWNRKGPNRDNVAIILTYSDGSEKRVPFLTENILDLDRNITSPCTTQFKVRYNDNGVVVETTVTVTITN